MNPTDYVYYQCTSQTFRPYAQHPVRWLAWEADYAMVEAYWAARNCPLPYLMWLEAREMGYHYAAVIEHGAICSVAAAWNYSKEKSELAAVSTGAAYRCHGYAKSVCAFVTGDILRAGQAATMMTGAENVAMQRTGESLGYLRVPASEGMANRRLMNHTA